MNLIDNINTLLGDDLKTSITPKSKVKIAASCFSIYAYEVLKAELSQVESLEFIFTAPTFVANEVTDKVRKERREFFIPKPADTPAAGRRGPRRTVQTLYRHGGPRSWSVAGVQKGVPFR